QLGIARAPAPEPEGIREIAARLIHAENPFVIVSRSGRDPASFQPLVTLCELLGLPVVNALSRAFNSFPLSHPLYQGACDLSAADMVLVIDSDVPWMPGPGEPGADAYVAEIGIDPVKQKVPSYEFSANIRLISDPALAIS